MSIFKASRERCQGIVRIVLVLRRSRDTKFLVKSFYSSLEPEEDVAFPATEVCVRWHL